MEKRIEALETVLETEQLLFNENENVDDAFIDMCAEKYALEKLNISKEELMVKTGYKWLDAKNNGIAELGFGIGKKIVTPKEFMADRDKFLVGYSGNIILTTILINRAAITYNKPSSYFEKVAWKELEKYIDLANAVKSFAYVNDTSAVELVDKLFNDLFMFKDLDAKKFKEASILKSEYMDNGESCYDVCKHVLKLKDDFYLVWK